MKECILHSNEKLWQGKERWLAILQAFFEYMLIIFIIIECNSLYTTSVNNNSDSATTIFVKLACYSAFGVIVLLCVRERELICQLKFFMPILGAIYVYLAVFMFANVVKEDGQIYSFSMVFCVFFALISILFFLKKRNGMFFDLWYKYSDIIVVIAAINIVFYAIVTVNVNILRVNELQTRWSHLGTIRYLCNYYNFCNIENDLGKYLGNYFFGRNLGFFPEPLMFAIPLIISLYIEFFFRDKKSGVSFRIILLTVTLITTQATLGIIIACIGWGLKILKILDRENRKKVIIPIIGLCIGVIIVLVKNKYQSMPRSFVVHVEDYIYAFNAFLKKPWFGGGYGNENYIRLFMPEERISQNMGFSNSIAVILAEGGIYLSLFFWIPFLIGIFQFFHKKNRHIAYWTTGIVSLYCLTIFHFHMILLMMVAFLYSLLEFDNSDGKRKVRIAVPEVIEEGIRWSADLKIIAVYSFSFIIVCLAGKFCWEPLYYILKKNGLLIGNHIWYWIGLCAGVIFLFCFLSENKKNKIQIVEVLIYTGIYLLSLPTLNAWICMILKLKLEKNDFTVSICRFFVYFIGIILIDLTGYLLEKLKLRRVIVIVGIIGLFAISGWNRFVDNFVKQYENEIDEEQSTLDLLAELEVKGNIYVDDYPVICKKKYPFVKYSVGSRECFSEEKDTTILMKIGKDIEELFNNDYQITKVSSKYILYSNDSAVIDYLQKEGYSFYRYYPYKQNVDLNYEARINNLEVTEEGRLQLSGSQNVLAFGPYVELSPSTYEVTYSLHIENEYSGEQILGKVQIKNEYGTETLVSQEILTDQFDEDGNLELDVTFSNKKECHAVEFLLFPDEGVEIEIQKISYRKVPLYVTIRKYNSINKIVNLRYFVSDKDEPYIGPEGYTEVRWQYDKRRKIESKIYYDVQGNQIKIEK